MLIFFLFFTDNQLGSRESRPSHGRNAGRRGRVFLAAEESEHPFETGERRQDQGQGARGSGNADRREHKAEQITQNAVQEGQKEAEEGRKASDKPGRCIRECHSHHIQQKR